MSTFKKERHAEGAAVAEAVGETDITSQLKRITDQLVFLEKKIDTLLDQTRREKPAFRPAFGNRPQGGNYNSYGQGNQERKSYGMGGGNRYPGRPARHGQGHGGGNFQQKFPPRHSHHGNR